MTSLDTWATVEIMGHRRFAGRVTEQQVAGATMLRIDVPDTEEIPGFVKLYPAHSIYGITLCTEAEARRAAADFHSRPLDGWMMRALPPGDEPVTEADFDEWANRPDVEEAATTDRGRLVALAQEAAIEDGDEPPEPEDPDENDVPF